MTNIAKSVAMSAAKGVEESSQKSLEFWYEFASPYSYLAAMRVNDIALAKGVCVSWKPFLLGPIFQQQGLDDSPFNIFKTKGAYMWRDVERVCLEMGLDFTKPDIFPQNGLSAARLALCDEVSPKMVEFTQAVFSLQFGLGMDISDSANLNLILENLGLNSKVAFAQSQSVEVKQALRSQTEQAVEKHIFGAPMFVTNDEEMFWGNDRIEQAVAWARGSGHKG